MKYLYTENVKHWSKKLKTPINRKISHVHWLEELILLKCSYYLKRDTNEMPNKWKFQWHCFHRNIKKYPKFPKMEVYKL